MTGADLAQAIIALAVLIRAIAYLVEVYKKP